MKFGFALLVILYTGVLFAQSTLTWDTGAPTIRKSAWNRDPQLQALVADVKCSSSANSFFYICSGRASQSGVSRFLLCPALTGTNCPDAAACLQAMKKNQGRPGSPIPSHVASGPKYGNCHYHLPDPSENYVPPKYSVGFGRRTPTDGAVLDPKLSEEPCAPTVCYYDDRCETGSPPQSVEVDAICLSPELRHCPDPTACANSNSTQVMTGPVKVNGVAPVDHVTGTSQGISE